MDDAKKEVVKALRAVEKLLGGLEVVPLTIGKSKTSICILSENDVDDVFAQVEDARMGLEE